MWVMPHPVILIASGDLRPAANQLCWPAQKAVEDAVSEQIRKLGHEVATRAILSTPKKVTDSSTASATEWKYSGTFPAMPRLWSWKPYGNTAITSCPDSSTHRGSDPHGCELERPMARTGGHAEPQRLAYQSRR